MALLLSSTSLVHAEAEHPLEPLDTSSPRATLNAFVAGLEDVYRRFRDDYWDNASYATYQDLIRRVVPVLRTLNLSDVPPSARGEVSYQAAVLLYEVLARIELPPLEEVPDAACTSSLFVRQQNQAFRLERQPREGAQRRA